jgi:hypothetical protein
MNTSKAMTVLVGGAASVAAVGLTVGLAVAAAAPAASGATLSLCPDFGKANYYRVTISGVFFMSQADAAGYLIHLDDNPGKPGGMTYYLQADDGNGHEGDESLLYQFVPHATTDSAGYLKAVPAGLEYRRELSCGIPGSTRTAINSTGPRNKTRSTPLRSPRMPMAVLGPSSARRSSRNSPRTMSATDAVRSHTVVVARLVRSRD